MTTKRYAFIVENEVFDIIEIPDNEYYSDMISRWSNGFANNAYGIDLSDNPEISVGSIKGEHGFDNSNVSPEHSIEQHTGLNRFGMISNDVVFGTIILSESDPKLEMYKAAFETGVTCVEVLDPDLPVTNWWIWDGNTFSQPIGG